MKSMLHNMLYYCRNMRKWMLKQSSQSILLLKMETCIFKFIDFWMFLTTSQPITP